METWSLDFTSSLLSAGRKRSFANWIFQTQQLELLKSAKLEQISQPGESERDFRVRLQQAAREERDRIRAEKAEEGDPKNTDGLADAANGSGRRGVARVRVDFLVHSGLVEEQKECLLTPVKLAKDNRIKEGNRRTRNQE